MSFQFNFTGHSSEPHNAEVEKVFKTAVEGLSAIKGVSGTGSGYSGDTTGSVNFSATIPQVTETTGPAESDPASTPDA